MGRKGRNRRWCIRMEDLGEWECRGRCNRIGQKSRKLVSKKRGKIGERVIELGRNQKSWLEEL